MFNHYECIAGRCQAPQDCVDTVHISRVEANTGFIEDKERVDEIGAQSRRKVYALYFAAGKRTPLPIER